MVYRKFIESHSHVLIVLNSAERLYYVRCLQYNSSEALVNGQPLVNTNRLFSVFVYPLIYHPRLFRGLSVQLDFIKILLIFVFPAAT